MSKAKGKTLVQFLAEELKEWPEGAVGFTQDWDGEIWPCSGLDVSFNGEEWVSNGLYLIGSFLDAALASDYKTAIVTRPQWEAERAKLSKPKASKDGWIRHRGGKCPVEKGVLVDVRFRDGKVAENCKALTQESGHDDRCAIDWFHTRVPHDIMAYRIRHPNQSDQPGDAVVDSEVTAQIDGPLQWRDRITEIDRTVEALEEERVSLVHRLANEGLQLIGDLPIEYWRVGDLVVRVSGGEDSDMPLNTPMPITFFDGSADGQDVCINGFYYPKVSSLKWHSRPSK